MSDPEEAIRRTSGVQVISRAADVLRALSGERNGLSLADIAARVGLPRSTVHRIVSALEEEGFTAPASPNGRYCIGPELIRLAGSERHELRAEVRPFLERISGSVDETVDLSVLIHDHVSFIDQVAAPHRLRAVSAIGSRFPAYCTSNGKVLLAQFDDDHLKRILPRRLERLTPSTITDRGELLEHLAEIRVSMIGFDREEHTPGISAVATSIRDAFGLVAAVSIPLPTQRFIGNEGTLVDALLDARTEISTALGAI